MELDRTFSSEKYRKKKEQNLEQCKDEFPLKKQKIVKPNLNEVYLKLTSQEKQIKIKPLYNYMNFQTEINEKMRLILIDWIISIHNYFKFIDRTLYQTIWIIDTFLSSNNIKKSQLQLVGVASLLISCKFNEINCPKLDIFIAISDNAFNLQELLLMETKILKSINYNLLIPTLDQFYDVLSKNFNFNKEEYFIGKFFLEYSLLNYEFIKYNILDIIFGCIYIALAATEKNSNYYHFKKSTKNISKKLYIFVKNLQGMKNINAINEKYSKEEYFSIIKGFL